MADFYTGKWIDESVIYHIIHGIDWVGIGADKTIIYYVIISLFCIIIFLYFFLKFSQTFKIFWKNISWFFIVMFCCFSWFFHPFVHNFIKIFFIKSEHALIDTDLEYKNPEIVQKSEKPKNLVYIYLESFENTFTDEKIFPNLTPNINNLKKSAITFENISQVYGTTWTIAGMVGSQCGIPLVTSGGGFNSMHGFDDFLPRAVCLGDILKNFWYYLVSLSGADQAFAGKNKFYKTHSFDEVLGKLDFKNRVKDVTQLDAWGLNDDVFLDLAFEEYEKLSQKTSPFALFLVTLDTHGEDGVISWKCKNRLYDAKNTKNILNSYHCVDFLIWEFVKKIQNHPNFKNTIIVISSDHYAMKSNNQYNVLVKNEEKRRNLFLILDGENSKIIEKTGSTLDIWPTILNFVGFEIEKLWIWVNLMNENNVSQTNEYVKNNKKFFEKFWTFPNIKNGIKFDVKNKNIVIEDKTINLPSLIYVDVDFDTDKILWDDLWNAEKLKKKIQKNSIFIYMENENIVFEYIDNAWKSQKQYFSEDVFVNFEDLIQRTLK